MSRIAVFGAGYVGLVTGACFADLGHDVVVRDVLPEKIDALRAGRVPIHEPGLSDVIERAGERLRFTLDVSEALDRAELAFVAVGTPPTHSGDPDLSAVWTVVDELPEGMDTALVMKSTVPPGTGEKVRRALDARGLLDVAYVSNPEFLAEGTAVHDFMHPDRVVIGAFEPEHAERVAQLYETLDTTIVCTDVASAEMIKLASNAFLSTRISFINEIASVCELVGADVVDVAAGIGLDHRLGPHFLKAGLGFGGSCLVGEESVLVRWRGRISLVTLRQLYEQAVDGEDIEILSWRDDETGLEFGRIAVLTRRVHEGEIVEVRTKMGRRVQCTPDHLLVTKDGRKLASEVTAEDWVPVAQGAPAPGVPRRRLLNVVGALERVGLDASQVIVRPERDELAAFGAAGIRDGIRELGYRRGAAARAGDILRSGALRLDEAALLDLEIEDAKFGTAKNGTYVPATVVADEAFWRVVGLYLAEGHCHGDGGGRQRLCWSLHPTDEDDLVEEVAGYWRAMGVKATVSRRPTATVVSVSSRLLAAWWLEVLGLGRNCYEQRVPDLIWGESEQHKRALISGAWRGDGSWSLVAGGPSVVLEYGTVSRELADGMLRLLAELGIVARLKIGRTAKSTTDTYWLVVSGADQVEVLLDLVSPRDRSAIAESLACQQKRIAATGYRRERNAAWVRVTEVTRRPFKGHVYSLEVPPTHTFVTTGGLVVSNCFPKDVSALKQLAGNSGYHFQLLSAVIEVNELQRRRVIQKLQKHLGDLHDKEIAVLGLAFKPGTDDLREAPSLVIAARLLAEGADVRAWDPVADARSLLPEVTFASSVLDAVRDVDAAVVVTEWPEVDALATPEAYAAMRRPIVVDGRNVLDPEAMRTLGFVYEGVGRPVHVEVER
ncbi:MAG: nucleotide sugar dehydrogenase [Gaiellaceae bacterium]